MHKELVWEVETARFRVAFYAEEEFDLDLSWDETGEIAEQIEDGALSVFCAAMRVYFDGQEIACDYLGQCIYASPEDFRDHVGLGIKSREDGRNYGSYFADMVRTACREAREHIRKTQPVYVRAAA